MRRIVHTMAVLVTGLVALWLLNDAMTFALYAPWTGHRGGCYTAVELWLGVSEPHDAIREAEGLFGLSLLSAVVGGTLIWAIRRRRRGKR